MSVVDDLKNLLGMGGDSIQSILAGTRPTYEGQAAPQAAPAAATAAPPPATGDAGVPTPPPRPADLPTPQAATPGTPAPPDISALYQKMLDRDRGFRMIDSGATMFVASRSSPQMKAALTQGALASDPMGQSSNPADTLKTLMMLQSTQAANQQKAARLARLPAIAQQLGISTEAAQNLEQSGELDKFLAAHTNINKTFEKNSAGQIVSADPQSGKITLAGDEQSNPAKADPAKKQVVEGPNGPVVVDLTDGSVIDPKVGLKPQPKTPVDGRAFDPITGKFGDQQVPPKPTAPMQNLEALKANPPPGWPAYNNTTDPAYAGTWGKAIGAVTSGGGQNININGQERAVEAARGKLQADDMALFAPAQTKKDTLSAIEDALNRGGDNITTGPFAQHALNAKQAIGSVFGTTLAGTSEAEVANSAGLTYATAAAKALSSRPTQMEFGKILEAKPGIFTSREGSLANINILRQQANAEQDLARIAQTYKGDDYLGEKAKYYKEHPIMSPFDPSKPLGQSDVARMQGPTQDSINLLKSKPELAHKFDEMYGPGASRKVLGR